ncbi:MAG: D-alanine--poly(phosphoribitol) ligase subunit DltC [Clostridiales Family XIII bacterium]|jgi:D-alanine--poly(phosphoribitol) ligase subunit 2|nr:D-alanine--poly(phosphoribitol) ligase subunit DltC [Clostridiales Family XIII bacterium]
MNEKNKAIVFDILEELTETDEVRANPDIALFDEGLLDSIGAVQLLVEIEAKLGVSVPISSFDRDEWATPNRIIANIGALLP